MSDPILIILHQEQSTPGRVGQALRRRGLPLDIRRPRFGDALPETMDAHAGAVIFGGPMSANDEEAFVHREIDWIGVPLRDEKPFLGICLGAQMLAKHLGARVAPDADGRAEIGYYPLHPTPEGEALLDWPAYVYQWHREGFDVPAGATLLAEGDIYPNQAFRYGPATFALQFHPELTLAMMHRWTVRGHDRLSLPGARARAEHFRDRGRYDPHLQLFLERFLDVWLPGEGGRKRGRPGEVAAGVAAQAG
jgi:GMP synthase (glutamine-hydrolysing)